jgi:D-alanyl-D-alanine carboxypeptidase
MDATAARTSIESQFRRQARSDAKVKNAYLLVDAARSGVELSVAEGTTGSVDANIRQPVHLASVGKLFTATIIDASRRLAFDDEIARSRPRHVSWTALITRARSPSAIC